MPHTNQNHAKITLFLHYTHLREKDNRLKVGFLFTSELPLTIYQGLIRVEIDLTQAKLSSHPYLAKDFPCSFLRKLADDNPGIDSLKC